jgi:hypothetical protein
VIRLKLVERRADNVSTAASESCTGQAREDCKDFFMSLSSSSLAFFSQVGPAPTGVAAAPAAPMVNDNSAAMTQSGEAHGSDPGRRNVLYEAMLAALQKMGLTAAPRRPAPTGLTAPAAGTVPPSTPVPATAVAAPVVTTATAPPNAATAVGSAEPGAPAPSVEDLVFSFAHALWQELRAGDADSSRGEQRLVADHRDNHGQRRQDQSYAMSRGYSGLVTRLEALAVRLDASPAGISPSPVVADVGAASASQQTPTPAVQTSKPAPAQMPGPSPAPPESPLAQAFEAMMRVLRSLNPNPPPADAAAPSLASFLNTLAHGLGADRTTPMISGIGVVINTRA